jgi:hypothetical protein
MTRHLARRLLVLLVVLLALGVLAAPPALAHGERSQEAFLRMRTIGWLGTEFSNTTIRQGESFTITGTAKLMEQWPDTLAAGEPKIGQIGVISPGPVVLLKERTVNGVSAPCWTAAAPARNCSPCALATSPRPMSCRPTSTAGPSSGSTSPRARHCWSTRRVPPSRPSGWTSSCTGPA